ncbi:lmo0937 family membrane protein [Arcicella sp. BE51]|uniref:lmo0937 family membrane protein n=1 Tax=Arcicella sp. BE51 TaxID=2817774 RepID=UPI002864F286|nr:hypothetical protein [Arcicella sp. BE51]MDR6810050.1 hypothetical protein [Arcicella sp. BE140]MDR6821399.1 hypothetical protein [Arcicella sp. BE139]
MYNLIIAPLAKNIFSMIAFLLLISWVISVFMFSINGLVHLFLVFALITVLISIIHKEM